MILKYRARMLSFAILTCAMLCCVPALAATNFDLDGKWQFHKDPSREGVARGWSTAAPESSETVDVPHTWNIGKYDDYEGTARYFKTFEVSDELRAKHVELNFGATFYRTRVWLNGVELGGHEGGFTAYHFDVTAHVKRFNSIAVEIDNMPTTETIPGWALRLGKANESWYDWWHYGGIVRDVWLSVSEPALVRRQQIRVKVDGTAAAVTTRVFLENFSGQTVEARLKAKVVPTDGGGAAVFAEEPVILKPGVQEQTLALRIEGVKLWHFDHPYLYRLDLELIDAHGRPLDSRSDTFGARAFELRDRHLYLNGERVRLSGITRHEDSPWEGLAETRGTIRHDYDDLKALQVTFTRPVHYPQHPDVLDYCDRNGILLAPEIPIASSTSSK